MDHCALDAHPYAAFVGSVEKPGRYLGGEEQSVVKPASASIVCRFALAFPDLYEIGMSHLGTRILYDLINRAPDLACERAFSPWPDMEKELRRRKLELVSLETYMPLSKFDVVGMSLQYELSYTNVLLNLELGGIPLRSAQRGDNDPIVLAGGPTATHPEPLAPFIDAFLVGEAEEVLPLILRMIGHARSCGASRSEVLANLVDLPGVYIPEYYQVEDDEDTGMSVVVGLSPAGIEAQAPDRVERAWVRDLEEFPFPTRFPVPYAEAIFDRASVEITRGCTEGCRFCQAGMIYRPVREREPDSIIRAVLDGTDAAGFAETSLTALSTADVSCIEPLIKKLVPELAARKTKLGVASLRAYGLSEPLLDDIKSVGIDGLTFAPEAGTQRLRDVINKNVTDEHILTSARRIFERGYQRMKLYFMMGLPTETDEDVAGILDTADRVREVARSLNLSRPPQIVVSISQHVPKPHTPFQWAAMESIDALFEKTRYLRNRSKRSQIQLKTHAIHTSWLECLFARGDRKLADVLERAYLDGARFDGWTEHLDMSRWRAALSSKNIDASHYTRTLPVGARLPWDHIDIGLDPGFLEGEYKRAVAGRLSPPCGKPFGAMVHHADSVTATADHRTLVCYDCGIACDLTQMREERIDALDRLADRPERPVPAQAAFVPIERLRGKLAPSQLADDNAFKHNAEAPYSRVRVFFAKTGTAQFLGHLDVVRLIPRMMRRAGLEMGFSRGFRPQPRMSMGPALALGMAGREEVVDLDLLLDGSIEDMAEEIGPDRRAEMAAAVLSAMQPVAPPGLSVLAARVVAPGEKKLGEILVGADYSVRLSTEELRTAQARLDSDTLGGEWLVRRTKKTKTKRGSRRPPPREVETEVNIRPVVSDVRVDVAQGTLSFRLRSDCIEASARPREVVRLLLGDSVAEYRFTRERLLGLRDDGRAVGLSELGPAWRSRPTPAPSVAAPSVAAHSVAEPPVAGCPTADGGRRTLGRESIIA